MAYTDDIAHRLADFLRPDLPGFDYLKSRNQFRKQTEDFIDYIFVNVISRSGSSYTVAFFVGVAHGPTEKLVAEIEDRKVTPYNRTVFQYSVNVSKQSAIPFSGRTWWGGLPRDTDFSGIADEIRSFTADFMLPYHAHFHDLLEMRESLVKRDGLSLNQDRFKQVLAIDALLSDGEHINRYCHLLQTEVDGGYHHNTTAFSSAYECLSKRFPGLFPSFQLQPKKRA